MKESEIIQSGFGYALSLTHNEHDAEDCVQEACYRLYKSKGAIDNRSLLFTIIRNYFIDKYRKSKIIKFEPFEENIHSKEEDEDFFSRLLNIFILQ